MGAGLEGDRNTALCLVVAVSGGDRGGFIGFHGTRFPNGPVNPHFGPKAAAYFGVNRIEKGRE